MTFCLYSAPKKKKKKKKSNSQSSTLTGVFITRFQHRKHPKTMQSTKHLPLYPFQKKLLPPKLWRPSRLCNLLFISLALICFPASSPKAVQANNFPILTPTNRAEILPKHNNKFFQKTFFCCSCGDDDDDESNHNNNSIYRMYKHLTKFSFRPLYKNPKKQNYKWGKKKSKNEFFFF